MSVQDGFLPPRMDGDARKHLSALVNNDEAFTMVTQITGMYAQTLYECCVAASPSRARFVAVFVTALYLRKYFESTQSGQIQTQEEQQQSARGLIRNLCDGKGKGPKSVYLGMLIRWKAQAWFYTFYPQYKDWLEGEGAKAKLDFPYNINNVALRTLTPEDKQFHEDLKRRMHPPGRPPKK